MPSKNKKEGNQSNIILAMIMLRTTEEFNYDVFINDFNSNYSYKVSNVSDEDKTVVLDIEDETAAIASMPFPVPHGDIEGTAEYAYNWMTAEVDLKGHKAHIVLSLVWGSDDTIKRFKILTSAICSILRTHDAIGVYKGAQSLLIPKKYYLIEARKRSNGHLPLNLWIYFGLRTIDEKTFGYTYGLKAFNKKELEILNSKKALTEIREFLYNMAHYILDNNVEFKDGQTCGVSADERVKISLSKGRFVEGESFKLAY